jgi:hypothetical protein
MTFETSWVRNREAEKAVDASVRVLGERFNDAQETPSGLRS